MLAKVAQFDQIITAFQFVQFDPAYIQVIFKYYILS